MNKKTIKNLKFLIEFMNRIEQNKSGKKVQPAIDMIETSPGHFEPAKV